MKTYRQKLTSLLLLWLTILLGCGEDEKPRPTLSFYVYDDAGSAASGATVEIYNTSQEWLDGDAPLATLTTNSEGRAVTSQKLSGTTFVGFAEKGNKNNWPVVLTDQAQLVKAVDGVFYGGSGIYESFLQDVESVSGKSYLLTDVVVNGQSIFANVDACSKDNFIKLGINQKMTYSEAALVCPGKSPQSVYDFATPQSKSSGQTVFNGQIAYNIYVTGLNSQAYASSDFNKIYLSEAGSYSVYTRQN